MGEAGGHSTEDALCADKVEQGLPSAGAIRGCCWHRVDGGHAANDSVACHHPCIVYPVVARERVARARRRVAWATLAGCLAGLLRLRLPHGLFRCVERMRANVWGRVSNDSSVRVVPVEGRPPQESEPRKGRRCEKREPQTTDTSRSCYPRLVKSVF